MGSLIVRLIPLLLVGFVGITFADDMLRRFQLDDVAATRSEKEYIIDNTPTWLLIHLSEIFAIWIAEMLLGAWVGDVPICFASSFLIVLAFRSWDTWRIDHDIQVVQKIRKKIDGGN
jgi:hypothetical protein